jgi:hypothetical protein
MRHLVTVSFFLLTAAPFFPGKTATNEASPATVAAKFLDLFDRLRAAQDPAGDHRHVAFQLTETEVNEYLRHSLKATPRPGLDSVTVKFFAKDYVSTFIKVDFDAVERWHPGTIPAVIRPILKGKKSIWIDCRIHADGSQLTFSIEKARYEDMALPTFFVEKMIQLVGARQPEKYDTTRPMPIPFGLSKVWTTDHTIQGNN